MENKELLLAISDMMDHKLESVHVRMNNFDTKLDSLDTKIDAVDFKIDAVENKLSTEIFALDAKIDSVEDKLSADISALDAKIDTVNECLSADIRKINVSLEHTVIPRIKHIEQCYVATSDRYTNEIGRIDGLVFDVQVIKSVVQDHSTQLQKIS